MVAMIKMFWESRLAAWILGIAALITASYFLWHSPVPGVAVAVLGAVAVVITLRDLKPQEKVFWTIVATLLLVGELRAIRVDRSEQNRHQLEGETRLRQQFADVRKIQNQDFQQTAGKLETAIGGIQTTLSTANKTLNTANQTLAQTTPIAIIRQDKVAFLTQKAPKPTQPGEVVGLDDFYTNVGNANALLLFKMVKMFVGKEDDKAAQTEFVRQFEDAWTVARKTPKPPFLLVPLSQHFDTTDRSFSYDELANLSTGKKQLYVLERIEYSDHVGSWRSDFCGSFQKDTDMNVMHTCQIFVRQRYPVKRISARK
jgi:hypothetical protein